MDVGNLISGSSAFLNPAVTSGIYQFPYWWSLDWRILSITLLACEMSTIVQYFEYSLALFFSGIGMKTDLFPFLWPLLSFPNLLAYECSTLTASSFKVLSSSTQIPSLPLAWYTGSNIINVEPLISTCYLFWLEMACVDLFTSCPVCVVYAMKVKVLVAQLCPTLFDPMDCSPPDSIVHGILQARILEWIVISVSRLSSQSRDWTQICITDRFFNVWATREVSRVTVLKSMIISRQR